MARRPPPPPKAGLPPAFFAVAVILVAVFAVFYIGSKVGPKEEPAQQEEKRSPFADVPEELPPNASSKSGSPFASKPAADDDAGGGGSNPFADLADPKSEQLWKDAMELGDAGMDLAAQAGQAKEAGDHEGFKALGTQAKEKLSKALEITADWETGLVSDLGASHPEVRSIQRTRTIWRNRLVALKKTVGL